MMMRILVVAVSALSVCFNIAHVQHQWLAQVLAATPPVLLFLSVEALLHTVKKEVERGMTGAECLAEEKPLSRDERRHEVQQYLADGLRRADTVGDESHVTAHYPARYCRAREKWLTNKEAPKG